MKFAEMTVYTITKSALVYAASKVASYPGLFEKSEKRAWYPLFAHFLTFRKFRVIP